MTEDSNSGLSPRSVKKVEEISYNRVEPVQTSRKKRPIVEEDDPYLNKDDGKKNIKGPGLDPRFQQQNQSMRCFVMYTDFYRCEHILGQGHEACTWFKDVFSQVCPEFWITQWDDLRVRGLLPWHKHRSQGDFPGDKYGTPK